jgi:O-antigen/teichoic acid export membrane protein
MVGAAVLNLALSLLLTPELGIEGPALGTAIPFFLAFPLLLRVGLAASGASLSEVARWAGVPAYALGAALAAVLVAIRLGLEPSTLPAVLGTAIGGVLAYWVAFYGLVLTTNERAFMRSLVRA